MAHVTTNWFSPSTGTPIYYNEVYSNFPTFYYLRNNYLPYTGTTANLSILHCGTGYFNDLSTTDLRFTNGTGTNLTVVNSTTDYITANIYGQIPNLLTSSMSGNTILSQVLTSDFLHVNTYATANDVLLTTMSGTTIHTQNLTVDNLTSVVSSTFSDLTTNQLKYNHCTGISSEFVSLSCSTGNISDSHIGNLHFGSATGINLISTLITANAFMLTPLITSGTGAITDLTSTSIFYTSSSGTDSILSNVKTTNFTGTNLSFTTATGTNLRSTNFISSTGTITDLTSTNLLFTTATGTNFTSSTGTVKDLTSTNLLFTTATGTSLKSINFISSTGTITDLTSTNSRFITCTGSDIFLSGTTSSTYLNITTYGQIPDLLTSSMSGSNVKIQNLTNDVSNIIKLTAGTGTISDLVTNNLKSTNIFTGTTVGISNSLYVDKRSTLIDIVGSTGYILDLAAPRLSCTNYTGFNTSSVNGMYSVLTSGTGTISDLTSTNLLFSTATGSNITSSTSISDYGVYNNRLSVRGEFVCTTGTIPDCITTNLSYLSATGTNLRVIKLNSATGTISDLTSTNLKFTNGTGTSMSCTSMIGNQLQYDNLIFNSTLISGGANTNTAGIFTDQYFNLFFIQGNGITDTWNVVDYLGQTTMKVYNNGTLGYFFINNAVYGTTSDESLKKNIEESKECCLDKINSLELKRFNYKTQKDGEDKRLGLIAQDCEKISSEFIFYDKKEDVKLLDHNYLLMNLIGSIKELSDKVKILENKLGI